MKGGLPGHVYEFEEVFVSMHATLALILKTPDFETPFYLQTDYLDQGISAVLTQFQDGNKHPICYYGRKLLPHEQKYQLLRKSFCC